MAEILAEFGGMSQLVQPGDRVLVKPNMLEGVDKGKCVTTHPSIVRDKFFANDKRVSWGWTVKGTGALT